MPVDPKVKAGDPQAVPPGQTPPPGGDDDAPEGETPPPAPGQEKKFSQDDVNRLLAENKRGLQKKYEEGQKQLEAMQKQIADLQDKTEAAPDPNDLKGQLEVTQKKYQREIESLKKDKEDLEKKLTEEARKRRESERDKLLGDALQEAGCTDPVGGRRYFLPQIEWDEEQERWLFRTKGGGTVEINSGVQEEMPQYLRPASMKTGGTGTHGGGAKAQQKQREVESAKKRLDELHAQATRTGKPDDMVLYRKQKAVYDRLVAEQAKT